MELLKETLRELRSKYPFVSDIVLTYDKYEDLCVVRVGTGLREKHFFKAADFGVALSLCKDFLARYDKEENEYDGSDERWYLHTIATTYRTR